MRSGQYGLAKNPDGTGGTTPEDVQRTEAARYTNSARSPILRLAGVVEGRSDMAYAFPAGEALVRTANGAIVVNWDAGVTSLITTPAVTRTDTVYIGADRVVRVQQGGTPPADVAILGRPSLPGGATATTAMSETHNVEWALPYGAQVGWLAAHQEVHAHGASAASVFNLTKDIWVPTRRDVMLWIFQAIHGEPTQALPDGRGTMEWKIFLDGELWRTVEIPYDGRWAAGERTIPLMGIAERGHTLRFERRHAWGAPPKFFGGGAEKREHGLIAVIDQGVGR